MGWNDEMVKMEGGQLSLNLKQATLPTSLLLAVNSFFLYMHFVEIVEYFPSIHNNVHGKNGKGRITMLQ